MTMMKGVCAAVLVLCGVYAWIGLAGAAVAAPADSVLAGGDEPYAIVLRTNASATVRYAADELVRFMKEQTGVTLPVATNAPRERCIVLTENDNGLRDHFRIRRDPSGAVVISGNGRGVLFGVYELLRRFGGCEWYTPKTSVIPKLSRFVVPAGTDISRKAAFVTRETSWWPYITDPAFALRRRMNGTRVLHLAVERGVPVRPALALDKELWICHTFDRLCPASKFGKTHPEYFALRGNERQVDGEPQHFHQLCLTNPDVLKLVTERVLDCVRRHPESDIFGVSQNDNQFRCQCASCRAVEEEEGSPAGPVIRFVNAIAERVEREHPGKMIETLAYQYSRKAPQKTRPRDNVMVCLCTIELDFSKPIVGNAYAENRAFADDLRAWCGIGKHLYIWDYTVNFGHYPDVFPNVRTLAGNLRHFHEAGVLHTLEQGAGQLSHAWFADLKGYVISECQWNPDQDVDALTDRFMSVVYGAGAPFVRQYYDACCARYARDEAKDPMRWNSGLSRPSIPASFYDEMAVLWDKAAAAVTGDALREENVRWGMFWNDYTRAMLASRQAGVFISRHPEKLNVARIAEMKKVVARVIDVARKNPRECFYEADNKRDVKELERFLSVEAPTGPCDCARFEETSVALPFKRFGLVEDDPLAGNGKAIRRYGKYYDWSGAFYLKGMVLDPGGKYAIRLRARVNKRPGADPNGVAIAAGVYNGLAKRGAIPDLRVKASEIPDAGYHWYETAAFVPSAGDKLWFTPGVYDVKKGESNVVEDVWFDCFEVVRKDAPLKSGDGGFTVSWLVNLDNVKTNEVLYRYGDLTLSLRRAGKLEYDWNYGNYMNFPMPGGGYPVLEALMTEKGGRVGLPLAVFAKTGGVHRVTVSLSGVHLSMMADGQLDDDMPPGLAYDLGWMSGAREERLSPRVLDADLSVPARLGSVPAVPDSRLLAEPIQYWTPSGHNAWVGDVTVCTWKGRLHLFYLFDRRHHHSGVTAGRHYFAHLSTDDLVRWYEHPLAVPIERGYECIGTGTPFAWKGELCLAYGLHTDRITQDYTFPKGGTYARSSDGIHFVKSDEIFTSDQNPSVFNLSDGQLALATCNGKCYRLEGDKLTRGAWKPFGTPAPAGGDCPAPFSWGDRDYLLQGFYWMASRVKGGEWEDWTATGEDVYGGVSVPMVTEWKDGRRILAGWLQHTQGWGGWLVLRELVRFPDGRLGDKWPAETLPRGEILTYENVDPSRPFVLRCASTSDGADVEFRIDPTERRAQFAFPKRGETAVRAKTAAEIVAARPVESRFDRRNQKGRFPWWCGEAALGNLRGLETPFTVRLATYYDRKSNATVFDVEIAGCRTFITRRGGRFGKWEKK